MYQRGPSRIHEFANLTLHFHELTNEKTRRNPRDLPVAQQSYPFGNRSLGRLKNPRQDETRTTRKPL